MLINFNSQKTLLFYFYINWYPDFSFIEIRNSILLIKFNFF